MIKRFTNFFPRLCREADLCDKGRGKKREGEGEGISEGTGKEEGKEKGGRGEEERKEEYFVFLRSATDL